MRRLILATGWPGMNSSSVIVCAKGIRCGARPRGEVACRDASDARQNLATTFIFYPHGRLKNHVEGRAVNLERKWGWNPNQLRPTDLPRGFRIVPAPVVSPEPDAGKVFRLASISAFAELPLSTAYQLGSASACRGIVLAYRYGAASDFHRVSFCSLRTENQHRRKPIEIQDCCQ
jgi:hypothetical protein